MDVQALVNELRTSIETARALPMSSSAVINRTAVLELVERLESTLVERPALGDAGHPDQAITDARREADEVNDDARAERARHVSDTDIYRAAQEEAAALRREAEQETAELRAETDEYVDGRLATLELSLTKTLDAVTRGRARLHGRSHFDSLSDDSVTDPTDEGLPHPG